MAVAAYASVLALMRSLDNALLPRRRPNPDKSLIETLQEKVGLLQEFLELLSRYGAIDGSTILQIRGAVREADYLIDKYVVDQLRGGESDYDNSPFCEEIQALTRRIESANKELKAMATMDKDLQGRENPSHGRAPRVDLRGIDTTTMVGFDDLKLKIIDGLTVADRQLKIISIVGMGGIGKTTLARSIYNHRLVAEYFDFRGWVTVSQEFDVRDLLIGLLGGEYIHDSVDDLGEKLYKTLYGRRYLIVMDDVWSAEALEELRPYLPKNDDTSRILITTRIQSVVPSYSESCNIDLLDEEHSWILFCEKVFGHNSKCPSVLEEIGKRIVRGCNGLPLAIVVVAASVSKFGYDRSLWEAFAENMDSALDLDSDEGLTGVLSLSYNDLPIHLKLCFVSMTEFPKGRIEVCRLVELWVAVGIVRPTGRRKMEVEVAVEYVEDLIGRNMVTAVEKGSRGNIKTCAINSVFWQIGIRESQGESFLHVPQVQEISYSSLKSQNACFLCGKNGTQERFQLQEVLVGSLSTAFLNPTVCDDCASKHRQLNGSRSVRLVERVHDQRSEVPQVTKLTSLSIGDRFRFHSKEIVFASPSPVSLLWNLQRLYFHISGQEVTMLLSKIWGMPQLRYLHLLRHALPEPEDKSSMTVLQHLTTLKLVKNLRFTLDVVGRIPNLVRLSVLYDPDPKEGEELDCSYYCLDGLELFRDLQSLKLVCRRRSFDIRDVSLVMSLKNVSFPLSLVKLTLMDCKLSWKDMSVIGSLPNLEVLKLKRDSFVGEEWCTTGKDEFLRLRYLKLEDLDLVSWTISGDSIAFVSLTRLVLFGLYRLAEIPLCLGDLSEMQAIHASFCTQDVVEAVKQITEVREDCGYDNFRSVIE